MSIIRRTLPRADRGRVIETSTIRPWGHAKRDSPAVEGRVHAVVTRGGGGAIVTADRSADPTRIVRVERFGYEVGPIAARAQELLTVDPGSRVVLDVEGLGDAIWELVGRPRRGQGWSLYQKHGREREELTRSLLVAVERKEFRFAPQLLLAVAMRMALVGLTRNVREDGPGSELAVALSLAIDSHRRPLPRIG